MAHVLKHERFNRPAIERPTKRRGRLPRGVARLSDVESIKVGVLAEISGSRIAENNGLRVRILSFDPREPACWEARSTGGNIQFTDGTSDKVAWFKPQQLRRLWAGLSSDDLLKLRLQRKGGGHG